MHAIYFTVFRDDPSIFILAGIGDDSLETRKLRREKVSCEQRAENSMTPDPDDSYAVEKNILRVSFFDDAFFSRMRCRCSLFHSLNLDYEYYSNTYTYNIIIYIYI